jgi:hypothetical protein
MRRKLLGAELIWNFGKGFADDGICSKTDRGFLETWWSAKNPSLPLSTTTAAVCNDPIPSHLGCRNLDGSTGGRLDVTRVRAGDYKGLPKCPADMQKPWLH